MSFADLNLDPSILRALTDAGYENPTAIQAQSIPEALQGRDIMASAQTGTGKTAAFTLPALNLLATPHPVRSRGPRILVLTPTRELAAQVNEAARKYGKFLRARCISIVGGMPYPLQNKLLSQPLDILVATPGRFIDHLDRGRIDLSRLQMLVLDEADRMLDMGFMPDVERICDALPADRQTLLFSATLDGIMDIGKRFLRNPLTIQVAGQKEKHANIEQRLHFVDDMNHKNKLLEHLLIAPDVNQTIIFTSTKRHADLLAEDLYAAGHSTAALHGDMTQGARNRTLTKLRHGDVKVLVATDVAARGIDVQGISHVINYDLPKFAEDYVHRIGRTGRANNTGVAISFASNADRHLLRKIEQYTGQKLQAEVIAGFEPKRAVRMDDGGDKRGGKRTGKPQAKGGFRRDDRPGQNKSFGERVAREGGRDNNRGAQENKPRTPRVTEQKQDKEVNGNSKSYNKDTDFQFARALADEFGQRRPRPAANSQERFGNPNAPRSNNKPRPAGKSFGDAGGAKRPRSFA
ncbi:DEAD/DEAH box helicase [Methylophilus medardicus]|uniref:DEAD/DEAH box helicase n=1 Tax=Methylophilus medardicus TaxID=2588534 RepID=A0A5B8CS33_9PROT|nr:DEAD/DEAH box helicase [Methylophilus medardicus]QDC44093.1 DEAD/DEAH box helicase [Methylophilus medardicus]QDC49100.1 DEAD/DEAH box helicase [Methylophilus medardicus]QDC52805.1 DEAD/DEAH box helicase [Methylophilus medardicus]